MSIQGPKGPSQPHIQFQQTESAKEAGAANEAGAAKEAAAAQPKGAPAEHKDEFTTAKSQEFKLAQRPGASAPNTNHPKVSADVELGLSSLKKQLFRPSKPDVIAEISP